MRHRNLIFNIKKRLETKQRQLQRFSHTYIYKFKNFQRLSNSRTFNDVQVLYEACLMYGKSQNKPSN